MSRSTTSKVKPAKPPYCVGSRLFIPDELVNDIDLQNEVNALLRANALRDAVIKAFKLPTADEYVYHAVASVTLAQVQAAVNAGGSNGLHNWYNPPQLRRGYASKEEGTDALTPDLLPPPTQADIEAYISIFLPSTSTASALKANVANAKKGSTRATTAPYLLSKRFLSPDHETQLTIPKSKKAPANPYLDFWAWSCRNLEWCGPNEETAQVRQSHHVLPVFMHMFGCCVPSHESLEMIRVLAKGRTVVEIGSGNGYWTYMLRRMGLVVEAVDNMQSEFRTNWITDTYIEDGIAWLEKKRQGAKESALLMVYPVVGGNITAQILDKYQGDLVFVAGTQNANGYTGFKDMTIDTYMVEQRKGWRKIAQVALPSFAGKDEAMFVFEKEKS